MPCVAVGGHVPPRPKFTREEVLAAALDIVDEAGVFALTSRAVAKRLGSSTRPLFTIFADMEELQQAVIVEVDARFREGTIEAMCATWSVREAAKYTVRFAIDHPHLFELIIMSSDAQPAGGDVHLSDAKVSESTYVAVVRQEFGCTATQARRVFEHVWAYVLGLGAACVWRRHVYTEAEVDRMLDEVYQAIGAFLSVAEVSAVAQPALTRERARATHETRPRPMSGSPDVVEGHVMMARRWSFAP